MHVCVVDHSGDKHVHRNFDTKKTADFLAALQPFQSQDLIIGCESTFNWYWLADLCTVQNVAFLLGHALYLKAIHGGKTKTDRIDSEKLGITDRFEGGSLQQMVSLDVDLIDFYDKQIQKLDRYLESRFSPFGAEPSNNKSRTF